MNKEQLSPTWPGLGLAVIWIALWIGVLDAALIVALSDVSFAEVFLFGFGIWSISIVGYVLLTLLVTSLLFVLGIFLVSRILRIPLRAGSPLITALSTTGLTILLFGLRANSQDGVFSSLYAVMFLSVILSVWAASFLLKRKVPLSKPQTRLIRTLKSPALMLGLGTVFFLPLASDIYLRLRTPDGVEVRERPNVVLIVMDAVRADALSCYSNPDNLTPNLDKIASEGTLFLNAFAPAPWTLPSHASLFTGLYPTQHRARMDNAYLDEGFLTLAEILAQEGYRTAGFSENPFVSRNRGMAQGFSDFFEMYGYRRIALLPRMIDVIRRKLTDYNHTGEYTEDTVRYFKRWVSQHSRGRRPFFAFLNLMPAHLPNYPREEFPIAGPSREELARIEPVNRLPERYYLPRFKLNERELGLMRSLYEGDIAFLDSKLGELFGYLKEGELIDQTLLIVTSDHGENFGDHGLIEHAFCLYNTLLHVPLIVRYPAAFEPGTVTESSVSLLHTFRTILEVLDLPEREGLEHVESRSLLHGAGEGPVFAEHENLLNMINHLLGDEAPEGFDFSPFDKSMTCVYENDLKFIRSSTGDEELFHFRQDIEEKVDLTAHQAEEAARLRSLLRDWAYNLWIPEFIYESRDMDKKTREALKALGYIK